MASNPDVVKDVGKWEWSELLKKEDWWAVWLGFALLIAGMLIYFPQSGMMKGKLEEAQAKYGEAAKRTDKFKTIAWFQLYDAKKKVKALDIPAGKFLKSFSGKPKKWSSNPAEAFVLDSATADARKAKAVSKYEAVQAKEKEAFALAMTAEQTAEAAGFNDAALNAEAKSKIEAWRDTHLAASKAKAKTKVKAYNQIFKLIGLGICFAIFFGIGLAAMGQSFGKFAVGFHLCIRRGGTGLYCRQPGHNETLRYWVCGLGNLFRYAHQQHRGHTQMGHAGGSDRVLHQNRSGALGCQNPF